MFNAETFAASLPDRGPELVLALQALCFRFPPQSLNTESRQRLIAMARASRQLVMDKVFGSQVDCSILQTLCLLSLFEYAGSVCPGVWPTSISPANDFGMKPLSGSGWLTPPEDSMSSEMDQGIMKYTTPLAQVWREARIYASCRVSSDMLPPWNPRSDYSQIAYRHLEIDCSVPLKYRFSAYRIGEQTAESLHQHRDHWGPYLFTQFVYASIPIILNHPFLLSMRLRNFRNTMPYSFMNNSYGAITRHIGWIMYHLDLINRMAYQISDPTLAHVVVVVATIHLQHSFVDDYSLRGTAQAGFGKCLDFLHRMGSIWPSVAVIHENLQKLERSIRFEPLTSDETGLSGTSQHKFTIDTRLLWDLLSYEQAGRSDAHIDQSMFRGLSSTNCDERAESGASYDLVGSAGIIGHKTVAKDTPIYAPGEESPQQNIRDGFGSMTGPEIIFPQAHDFSRAIDEWLSLDWENTMA
ncbi:hypothetical protein F53441_6382 [Fusarium austroafricanum]|uniref:Transcription factor domain-containing protein n=1 Tax=Fusarium austroafricanum TaxID=2364996 RepID=A0A8H4P752_9HYPO|nr:hypothetical protein F53441_6382 [Fusarium austroafricanum]